MNVAYISEDPFYDKDFIEDLEENKYTITHMRTMHDAWVGLNKEKFDVIVLRPEYIETHIDDIPELNNNTFNDDDRADVGKKIITNIIRRPNSLNGLAHLVVVFEHSVKEKHSSDPNASYKKLGANHTISTYDYLPSKLTEYLNSVLRKS